MNLAEMKHKNITVMTDKKKKSMSIPKMVYKDLSLKDRLNRKINSDYISNGIKEETFYYHPFWIAKILVIADRKPFEPKVTPRMVFIDAMSGYRGILTSVPYTQEVTAEPNELAIPRIATIDQAEKLVEDIQRKQINSMYMLKKPSYKTKELRLHYLPLTKVKINTPLVQCEMLLNMSTMENEKYLLEKMKNLNL